MSPVVVNGQTTNQVQSIDPNLGVRTYALGPEIINNQGRGDDAGFDEVLLHAPGISRESSGQFHLRGEDYGLQYRLNGIQLPDGITSTLGQPFDTRLIQTVTVLSGTLPAEYGLRNAGVIELQTKTGTDLEGKEVSVYGGSHGTIHPSLSSGGTYRNSTYFISGSYLQNDLGTDNVTASTSAIHDQTQQVQGFAFLSDEIAPGQTLNLILSGVNATFQIPNERGLTPEFAYEDRPERDSATLHRNQREQNYFGIVAYELTTPDLHFQLAEVNSFSSTHYFPDYIGDLEFTGAASDAKRDLVGTGVQLDLSYQLNNTHTLKTGFSFITQLERSRSMNAVFPVDSQTGEQTSGLPVLFDDSEHQRGVLFGVYLQDAWQPLPALTVSFGGRFDYASGYATEHAFSPRINLVCNLTRAISLHLGYARIFSPPLLEYISPSVLREYVKTAAAPTSRQDSVPHAERSHSFSAGAVFRLARGLTLGVDVFYKRIQNMQDETQIGESLIFTPFTYRKGRKLGVECSAEYNRGSFFFYGNLAIAQTEGRDINSSESLFDRDELEYIANHYIKTDYDQLFTISAGAAYRWRNFTLHTDILAGSGMYGGFANSEKLESHWTANLGATYTFLFFNKTSLTARFDIINLFDQSYLLHDAGVGATVNQYGERRGFFGGLTLVF